MLVAYRPVASRAQRGVQLASFPGLRPDFISQPWHSCEIKSVQRPGNEARGQ